jgi:hypothetical protein
MTPSSLSIILGDAPAPADASTSTAIVKGSSLLDVRQSHAASLSPASLESLTITVMASQVASALQPMELAFFVPALKNKDAAVSICVVEAADVGFNQQPIHAAFLLAGLKLADEPVNGDNNHNRTYTARQQETQRNTAVRLNLADDNDDDDFLLDEDTLLQNEASLLQPPNTTVATKSAVDDCSGRAPCDNCTCGRAPSSSSSVEEKKESSNAASSSSACGKCALGDAFRCASCPHLGKPAWKAGEEHLVLDLQDDL